MAEVVSSRDQHRNIIWDIRKSGEQVRNVPDTLPVSFRWAGPGGNDFVPVMTRGAVVTHGAQIYFSLSSYGYMCPFVRKLESRDVPHYVFSYNVSGDEWSTLPPCEVHDFGLSVVNGLVTIVGGEYDKVLVRHRSVSESADLDLTYEGPSVSNSLFVLNGVKWERHFPPMIVKRREPSVICTEQYLIVVGGVSIVKHCDGVFTYESLTTVNSVEVMNNKTEMWSQVTSLPEAASSLVAARCGDQLYFLGGNNKKGSMSSMFMCCIQSLVKSKFDSEVDSEDFEKDVGEERLKQQTGENPVWKKVTDVPVLRSTCVEVSNELFAIGGRTSTYCSSADIYCYSPLDDSWQVVGKMPTARSMCIGASVMNKLVVIGGLKEEDEPTDSMEIGTFISGIKSA